MIVLAAPFAARRLQPVVCVFNRGIVFKEAVEADDLEAPRHAWSQRGQPHISAPVASARDCIRQSSQPGAVNVLHAGHIKHQLVVALLQHLVERGFQLSRSDAVDAPIQHQRQNSRTFLPLDIHRDVPLRDVSCSPRSLALDYSVARATSRASIWSAATSWPSRTSSTRGITPARSRSWVTMTIVLPCATRSSNSAKMRPADTMSRLPVGSSPTIT